MVEAVIAIGVLAVAIPSVFAAFGVSGKSGMGSQAETRGAWIIPACMEEIHASRQGRSRYFEATVAGQNFPSGSGVWALAFAGEGALLGRLNPSQYAGGLKEIDGRPVGYIVSMESGAADRDSGMFPLLELRLTLEHPAAASAAHRHKVHFHSRIP